VASCRDYRALWWEQGAPVCCHRGLSKREATAVMACLASPIAAVFRRVLTRISIVDEKTRKKFLTHGFIVVN
jgi:hypothetical protein